MKKTKSMFVFVLAGLSGSVFGQDANVNTVNDGTSTLTSVFGTVFALGIAVVIALVAKRYLRRVLLGDSPRNYYEDISSGEAQWLAWEDEQEKLQSHDRDYKEDYRAQGREPDKETDWED